MNTLTTNTITQQEKNKCREWGTARYEENLTRRDIADYDSKRFNLTNLDSNCLAVLAEFYVYKQVALRMGWSLLDPDPNNWAPFVESKDYGLYLKQPDIGGILEVRRANTPLSPLPLRTKDVEANAFVVQVYTPYTQEEWRGPIKAQHEAVEILGWREAAQAWDMPGTYKPDWSRSGRSRITQVKRDWDNFDWRVFDK